MRRIVSGIATTFFVNRCLICQGRTIYPINPVSLKKSGKAYNYKGFHRNSYQRELIHSFLWCKDPSHKLQCEHRKWLPGEREAIDPKYARFVSERLKKSGELPEYNPLERLMSEAPTFEPKYYRKKVLHKARNIV